MKKRILFWVLFQAQCALMAQSADSTRMRTEVSGAVSVTNNGISLVPTFSLGKPAALFDLSVRRRRFSFDPQLAFAFEDAKPWFFIFWLRYKLVERPKLKVGVGFHPGFVFSNTNAVVNGVPKALFTTARFFVGELSPNYVLNPNVSVGLYFLHSRGYNGDLRQLNFAGVNANFSNIGLGKGFLLRLNPQIYYLKTDDKDGVYATATVALSKRGLPLSIASVMNKKLRSNIPSDDFVWNLALTYAF